MGKISKNQRRNVNPLLMEPILEVIFEHLSIGSLVTCLTVCKLWSTEVIRAKNKRGMFRLTQQGDICKCLEDVNMRANLKHSKLKVSDVDLEDPLFRTLLLNLKPSLSALILADCKVTLPTLHQLLQLIPNLELLDIGTMKTKAGDYHTLFPIYDYNTKPPTKEVIFPKIRSLEYISYVDPTTNLSCALKTYPNLRSLSLYNMQAENVNALAKMQMPYLEELTIMSFPNIQFQDQHIKMISAVKLPLLKNLKIANISPDVNISLLKTFIESFGHKLESLDIDNFRLDLFDHFTFLTAPKFKLFPLKLPNLKILTVGKLFVQNLSSMFRTLPKLEHIAFTFNSQENWRNVLPKRMDRIPNVEGISVTNTDPKIIRALGQIFTGLTMLKIHDCDDDILRAVYLNMPNLEHLICFDSETTKMTSEGFTGIPIKVFLKSRSEDSDSDSDSDSADDDYDKHRNKPYIGFLTKLKHAHLVFGNHDACAGNILDHGLIDIPSLKTVILEGLELPPEVVEYLKTDYNCEVMRLLPPITNTETYKIFCCSIDD